MSSDQVATKREVMLAFLEHASVFVHLDPRRADVVVPQWFKRQPQLVLQLFRENEVGSGNHLLAKTETAFDLDVFVVTDAGFNFR